MLLLVYCLLFQKNVMSEYDSEMDEPLKYDGIIRPWGDDRDDPIVEYEEE